MVHHRNWIILVAVVLTLIAFIPLAQAGPPLKEGNPGLPGCLAKVNQLEQTIADQNLTILGLQEQIDALQASLDAMKNYAPVPQTGQTKCYDPYGEAEIPCTNTNQDGDLQKGIISPIPRFTDNNNGTVTDNLTRLVWLKNAHRWDPMHWDLGLIACSQLADDSSSLADSSQPGDWRMPNVREAMSLIDFGRSDPALPADHPFDNLLTGSVNYWTSTAHPPLSYVYFLMYTNGYVGVRSRVGDHNLVWCVRGPVPPQE